MILLTFSGRQQSEVESFMTGKTVTYIIGKKFVSFQKKTRLGGKIRIIVPSNKENILKLICKVLSINYERAFRQK